MRGIDARRTVVERFLPRWGSGTVFLDEGESRVNDALCLGELAL